MTDHITDTHTLTISVIQHANLQIQNVQAPTSVEIGDPFNVSYEVINNGATDTCWGHILDGTTELTGSRWEDTISSGAIKSVTYSFTNGITEDKTITIETGYKN